MGTFGQNWDDTFAPTSIAASVIANGATLETAAISNDGKLNTEIGVEVLYGTTASAGVIAYILRAVNDTDYEVVADQPYGEELARTVSTTHRRPLTVPASISRFKILLSNPSGADVTATVMVKQAEGVTA